MHTSRLHIVVGKMTLHSHQEIDANVSPSFGLRRPQNSGDPREPSHPLPSPRLGVTQRRPSCHHVSPWCGVCKRRKSSWSHSVRPVPHRRHAEHGARANFQHPWMPKRQCCTKEAEARRESGNADLFLQRDWIELTSPIPAGCTDTLSSIHWLSEMQLARIVSSNKRWQANLLLLVALCCPYSRPVFSTTTVWSFWATSGPCSVPHLTTDGRRLFPCVKFMYSRFSRIWTVMWLNFYSGATLIIQTFEWHRMTQHSKNRVTWPSRYKRG